MHYEFFDVETSGQITGMVHSSSGMQNQRPACKRMVQRKRNYGYHILLLGKGTSVHCRHAHREEAAVTFAEHSAHLESGALGTAF